MPTPQRSAPSKPLPETLFDLRARKVRVDDGWVLYNDVGVPLALEGDDLKISLDATGPIDRPSYLGSLEWPSVRLTARRADVGRLGA